jgi:F-type H+-transporting ATPase subunit b
MAENSAHTISTTEHVPASGQGHGFPPFERQNFLSQLFWLALTFIVLYVLMARIALPRIESIPGAAALPRRPSSVPASRWR